MLGLLMNGMRDVARQPICLGQDESSEHVMRLPHSPCRLHMAVVAANSKSPDNEQAAWLPDESSQVTGERSCTGVTTSAHTSRTRSRPTPPRPTSRGVGGCEGSCVRVLPCSAPSGPRQPMRVIPLFRY